MSLEIVNYSTILNELNKAVKMHNFYPEGHPQLDSALEKCFLYLKKSVEAQGEIKWKIDQKGFYDGKNPLAQGNTDTAALAKKLFFRRIKELTFTPRLDLRDLKIFLSAIKLEPEEIQARGGVETFFAEMDVSGILLNELRYEDLRKIKDELERKREEEKNVREEKDKPVPAGDSDKSSDEEEPEPKEETVEEPLVSLVDRIRNERDPLRYNDLAVRIKEKLDLLLIENKINEVYPALMLFYGHSLPVSGRSQEVRDIASARLHGLLNIEMLRHLAMRAGAKEEPHRAALQNILLRAGEQGADILLDAIIEAPEAVTRRHLFNALVPFGSMLRPLAEARLNNPEWYVARQMVSLLGEIGGVESLPALEAAYGNPEPRVKKEVLKSLVKIGTPKATEMLLSKLGEEDQSIVAQAIISLGMLKDPSAIDALAEIASKSQPFSDQQETKKEAIKALGIIGDPRAVPHLTRILFKKVWFGRKSNEEVRSLTAYSLGMIGNDEALQALEKTLSDSTGELRIACKRILEGREKNT